jgi:E3 ubiquitin-protein ligase DOA10
MSLQSEKILKYLQIGIMVAIFIFSTIFSVIGWLIKDKVGSVDDTLKDINKKIEALNTSDSDKAARIKALEELVKKHDDFFNKKYFKP